MKSMHNAACTFWIWMREVSIVIKDVVRVMIQRLTILIACYPQPLTSSAWLKEVIVQARAWHWRPTDGRVVLRVAGKLVLPAHTLRPG